jgi:hypothetical protein
VHGQSRISRSLHRFDSPVRIVHPDRLLSQENLDPMCHHTRFMERRLSIQDDHISISEMPVHLFVKRRRSRAAPRRISISLRSEQLVCDGRSLLERFAILQAISQGSQLVTGKLTKEICVPSSFCTRDAPGWILGPLITSWRSS